MGVDYYSVLVTQTKFKMSLYYRHGIQRQTPIIVVCNPGQNNPDSISHESPDNTYRIY